MNHTTRWPRFVAMLLGAFVIIGSVAVSVSAADDIPAFPGAEGFGAMSHGGRGGKVLLVTNLDDYDRRGGDMPILGSLRAACELAGPRILVFRVSGTIALKAPLEIREPFVTIAGQSAPGDGICLKDYGFLIRTHDVVVRYLRFRPGDDLGAKFKANGRRYEPDALCISAGGRDVVVDHCSASWCIDECVSVSGAGITNVTVQWCLISESLNESYHSKGAHGYGSLLRTNGNVTFHHNIYAHHRSRCPRPGTYGEGSILLDFRNNVLYDASGYSAEDPVRMNYLENYIKRPHGDVFRVGGEQTRLYVAGNILEGVGEQNRDNWKLISNAEGRNRAAAAFAVAAVRHQSAEEAYGAALQYGGATLPKRDTVDQRIVEQIKRGTGGLINSPQQVGGYPMLYAEPAPMDSDLDGMPDSWEDTHGLNAHDADDATLDADGDGYTNIEAWLNEIAAGVAVN